ncbi:MAG: NAD-dependent epimerase/dehydratase family protein [Elusimicrobia bacterium]|nr:NAD-dependent epimerase/dehydratase family protein [Elusimicrobiota bacterium]
MRSLVTGCAGYVGSHLVDRLLKEGHDVVGVDNFSTGKKEHIRGALNNPKFKLVRADLLNRAAVARALKGRDFVFHLAANADVRFGADDPRRDLEQNVIATSNVLEAMRARGVRKIAFSSTGSIYGEPETFPTPEDAPFPVQTSFYGASKLAAEGLIQAYVSSYGFQAWIFRFVSILGERYSHGHVLDFYRALRADPKKLRVLGDGKQRKSYLYVHDCLDAVLLATRKADAPVNILNLGTNETCTVNDSIGWICAELGVKPKRIYAGGKRGWVGDSPLIQLDCSKMRRLGWKPKRTIRESVLMTLRGFKR